MHSAQELGERIARAIKFRASQIGDLGYVEAGIAVARRLKRRKAYAKTTISGWVSGKNEPTLRDLLALADETGVARRWLVLNDGPMVAELPHAEPVPRRTGDQAAVRPAKKA